MNGVLLLIKQAFKIKLNFAPFSLNIYFLFKSSFFIRFFKINHEFQWYGHVTQTQARLYSSKDYLSSRPHSRHLHMSPRLFKNTINWYSCHFSSCTIRRDARLFSVYSNDMFWMHAHLFDSNLSFPFPHSYIKTPLTVLIKIEGLLTLFASIFFRLGPSTSVVPSSRRRHYCIEPLMALARQIGGNKNVMLVIQTLDLCPLYTDTVYSI